MSLLLPRRGKLTDALVTWMLGTPAFATADPPILVGDGKVPKPAGWPGGQVGVGKFVSSVTVLTAEATPAPGQPETLGSRHTSWLMPYRLRTISVARQGADAIADVARARAVAFPRDVLDLGEGWRVQEAFVDRLASINPKGEGDQETWEADDTVYYRITRARGR